MDEAENYCTELLLGMHRGIRQWWKLLQEGKKARLILKDGHVHTIDGRMPSTNDEKNSGMKFS